MDSKISFRLVKKRLSGNDVHLRDFDIDCNDSIKDLFEEVQVLEEYNTPRSFYLQINSQSGIPNVLDWNDDSSLKDVVASLQSTF